IAVDIDGIAAKRTAEAIGGNAAHHACDVTNRAACDALAETLKREVGAVSVLVNNAGIIRRGNVDDPKARADWGATPAGNPGTPEDIAGPAVFLASDLARYITGVTLPVDGGYLAL